MSNVFGKIVNKIRKVVRCQTDAKSYHTLIQDGTSRYFLDLYHKYKRYGKEHSTDWDVEQVLSELLVVSHTIEKGLTVPESRLGFGERKVDTLITLLDAISGEQAKQQERYLIAVRTLTRYVTFHQRRGYQLPKRVEDAYAKYRKIFAINELNDLASYKSMKGYEHLAELSFADFAKLRHSVRFYDEKPVEEEKVINAIRLAQTAPSTCNRQSTKVLHIAEKEKINQVLNIHSGCRSFASNIPTLLLLYSDLRDWDGGADFFGPYLDGGIFLMNLLYGLEYYSIGACPLNAYFSKENENALREILGMQPYEIPIALVACGNIDAEVQLPLSERRPIRDIYRKL